MKLAKPVQSHHERRSNYTSTSIPSKNRASASPTTKMVHGMCGTRAKHHHQGDLK